MLVAVKGTGETFPWVGTVKQVPFNPSYSSEVTIHWMEQERASHKPKWLRYFSPSTQRDAVSIVRYSDIILYDFQLTNKGCLKKKSRDYLKTLF